MIQKSICTPCETGTSETDFRDILTCEIIGSISVRPLVSYVVSFETVCSLRASESLVRRDRKVWASFHVVDIGGD